MRLIIVSGRSGSGKSTALDVLEDHGYYCIDNLPAGLLPELAERALIHTELAQPLVAVSIDARNLPSHLSRFPELLEEVRSRHIQCDVLYLGVLAPERRLPLFQRLRGHAILSISEQSAECTADAVFCLQIGSERIRFRVNLDALARSGVRVHPAVLKLARADEETP